MDDGFHTFHDLLDRPHIVRFRTWDERQRPETARKLLTAFMAIVGSNYTG